MTAERARDPLDLAVLLDAHALCVEVVHVLRPVLDGRVAKARPLAHEQLDGAGVQVGDVVLGCGAALDEVQVGARLHDDERVLELAGSRGVQAEVALQREVELHAGGHVDERAAAPHGVVKRGELVVGHGDERAKVLADHVLVARVHGVLDRRVDDAGLGDLILHVVVDDLRVVLGAHSCQARALRLGDAKALECVLDVIGHVVPALGLLGAARHVRGDRAHVQAADGRAPVLGHLHALVGLEGAQAHLEHPVRLVLLAADLLDDVAGQAVGEALVAALGLHEVIHAAVDVANLGAAALGRLARDVRACRDVDGRVALALHLYAPACSSLASAAS